MKLVLLSIDALMESDIPPFRKRPAMRKLLGAKAAPRIRSVYPSQTYVCHASLATGCFPQRTGITHNLGWPDGKWLWERKWNKAALLTDRMKDAGLRTASVCFPGTAGDGRIDINCPEIWTERPGENADSLYKKHSSDAGYSLYLKYGDSLDWMRTPGMDIWATQCAMDILENASPDFMMAHLSYLDHQKHRCGADPPSLSHAYDFIDSCVGKMLEKASGYEWIIVGDHGHRAVRRRFSIEAALDGIGQPVAGKTVIGRTGVGRTGIGQPVAGKTVIGQPGVGRTGRLGIRSASLSAQIYLEDGMRESEGAEILKELKARYPEAISEIFGRKELDRMRAGGDFSFMLESAPGVVFSKAPSSSVWSVPNEKSDHGHLPDKGPFPPLVFGRDFVRAEQKACDITDIAPTILALYGLDPSGMDGRPLKLLPG